jgi:hypothetical protein
VRVKLFVFVLFVVVGIVAGSIEAAVVVAFDDLTQNAAAQPVPASYGGLNWSSNWFYLHAPQGGAYNPGYTYGTVSAPNVGSLNGSGAGGTITSATPLTFNSAYFTDAVQQTVDELVTVQGLLNGVPVNGDTRAFTLSRTATAPSLETFNFVGINGVQISAVSLGNADITDPQDFTPQLAIDNITFNDAVPEPASLGFLALGGLALRRRRKV